MFKFGKIRDAHPGPPMYSVYSTGAWAAFRQGGEGVKRYNLVKYGGSEGLPLK